MPAFDETLPVSLLRDLLAAGVTPEAMAALSLYPAVYVAWSDGRVDVAEQQPLLRQAAAAGLSPAAVELLCRWLTRMPEGSAGLLDLAWRLVERMPAPAQRQAVQSAIALAEEVARATRDASGRALSEGERVALEGIVVALGGRSAETARREALTWGQEVEDLLPGYAVVGPDEAHAAEGPSASEKATALDRALPALESIRRRFRIFAGLRPSNRRKLQLQLEAACEQLDAAEQQLIGSAAPLRHLDGWSACRFVLLLVCRGATYDREHAALSIHAADEGDEWDSIQRALSRDRRPTLDLLHRLLRSTDVPFICRDYARVAVHLFTACRSVSSKISDCFLLPIQGRHDLRSAVGHAWCLYVDRSRHVAVPLDPTSADAFWERGGGSPFNPMLDARGLSNASTLLARLVEEPSPAVAAGQQMIFGLPPQQRVMLGARLLAQEIVALDFSPCELEHLWEAATASGAPPALATECIEHGERDEKDNIDEGDGDLALRRGRCAALFCAAGIVEEGALVATLRQDLERTRSALSAERARSAGVGRNDPCPCGSGVKYKRCCGR